MYSNFNRVTLVLCIMAPKPQVFWRQFLFCFNFECLVSQSCYSKTPGSTRDQLDINMAFPMRSHIYSPINVLHNGMLVSTFLFSITTKPSLVIGNAWFNSSLPRQNGSHFADDIFKFIFLNKKFCILIQISRKLVPKGPIDNKWAPGSSDNLAPNRQQAISWTNADLVHWRIYGALEGDELNIWSNSTIVDASRLKNLAAFNRHSQSPPSPPPPHPPYDYPH